MGNTHHMYRRKLLHIEVRAETLLREIVQALFEGSPDGDIGGETAKSLLECKAVPIIAFKLYSECRLSVPATVRPDK